MRHWEGSWSHLICFDPLLGAEADAEGAEELDEAEAEADGIIDIDAEADGPDPPPLPPTFQT